ncbi:MAG: thiamine pyrophosphate-dependent enzyme, partial [Planctomycetota bacterium]
MTTRSHKKAGKDARPPGGQGGGRRPPRDGGGSRRGREGGARAPEAPHHGLGAADLLAIYRNMLLSRELDDEEIRLKRKGQIFFQINGVGHEALLTAAGMVLRPGRDWFFPYYRDRALVLMLGVTPEEILLEAVGAATDPAGAGRQMPSHWGHPRHHVVNQSSCTGSQVLHAVGCAEAWSQAQKNPDLRERIRNWASDEVSYVSVGDGATSEGEFYEALNSACILRLPVLFLVEDNGYAISVPVEVQTAGGSISRVARGFPGLSIHQVDGCDPIASYGCLKKAVAGIRAGKGPALVHARVIRPYSHSLSDDERLYRTAKEREEELERDPLTVFPRRLVAEGIATEEELKEIHAAVVEEVRAASDRAVGSPQAQPHTVLENLYSPDFDPTDRALAVEPRSPETAKPGTMVDLLNAALRDEMERDPRIVVFGEDVADVSREEALGEVKGKGGVFKVTFGLQRRFGSERVYNSPLAEASIVGRAVGMALRGMKPVVEIQFLDYIWPAYHQIRSELSLLRWRSNGAESCPVVVRVAGGGYLRGGAVYHSQSAEALFTHLPGLRVVMPSNAEDANGLLRTAIRCDDPVIFLEHKHLYRQTHNKGIDPGSGYTIPFGMASRVREGTGITIITYGALVQRSLVAAGKLAAEAGIEVEILDLRTLNPYDWEAIRESVCKTSRALVVHEEPRSWGFGAEIAARVGEELFEQLDAPVRRVGALDCHVAYAPDLEEVTLPQVEDVFR